MVLDNIQRLGDRNIPMISISHPLKPTIPVRWAGVGPMIVDSSLSLTSSVAFALSSPPDYRECRLFKNCIGQGECGRVHICTLHQSQAHQVVSCRQFVGCHNHPRRYVYVFVLEVAAGVDDPKDFENMRCNERKPQEGSYTHMPELLSEYYDHGRKQAR